MILPSKKTLAAILTCLTVVSITTLLAKEHKNPTWKFQSIDTMKISRDLAREKLNDPTFAKEIDQQVKQIANTGATHVAIDTPYDEEFLPVLKLWVSSARKYGLNIWFRGNWSGWEQWFGYPQINQEQHIAKTEQFILANKNLFKNGDIFSSCPECENGPDFHYGNQDEVKNYRKFIITEYKTTKKTFAAINKKVDSNYFSMNADVAKAVMDADTTQALDDRIVIDHYVTRPAQLAQDVQTLAQQTGAKIVLGEIGAPIPDINGTMSDEDQKSWVAEALQQLATVDQLEGINYWTNIGGTTALWRTNGSAKPVVAELTRVFSGR